jgi:hypothetical protein
MITRFHISAGVIRSLLLGMKGSNNQIGLLIRQTKVSCGLDGLLSEWHLDHPYISNEISGATQKYS